jgi:hypothetical protein
MMLALVVAVVLVDQQVAQEHLFQIITVVLMVAAVVAPNSTVKRAQVHQELFELSGAPVEHFHQLVQETYNQGNNQWLH